MGTGRISRRKSDQLWICAKRDVEMEGVPGFEQLNFVHNALPEIDLDEVDVSTEFLGKELRAPIIISAITGGTKEATKINKLLASAAQDFGLGFEVGSLHAALEDRSLAYTYQVRDVAPDVLLFANLSPSQLPEGREVELSKLAIEMIQADALCLHLNPLQEAIQPEGSPRYRGVLQKIRKICSDLEAPVLVKETGSGISRDVGEALQKAGVSAVDVGGAGGTSWGKVEGIRRGEPDNPFVNWGIPTPVCVAELARALRIPVVAGGGIRSGCDAAKALCLGAKAVSLALPLLRAALKGKRFLYSYLQRFIWELKVTLFLTGSKNLRELRKVRLIPVGELADWLNWTLPRTAGGRRGRSP